MKPAAPGPAVGDHPTPASASDEAGASAFAPAGAAVASAATDEPEAPTAARTRLWQRLVVEQPLALQCVLVGVAVTALVAVWTPTAWRSAGAWWPLLAGLLVTLAVWLLTRPTVRLLGRFAEQAQQLERAGLIGEDSFSALGPHREGHRLSLALRRLVHAWRRQLRALQSRNRSLGQQLEQRSHELHSLEDLSIGLAQKFALSDLVDEALDALGQTIHTTSASIWARQGRKPGAPVRLLGCRSSELDAEQLAQLAGARLSRGNVALFEEIERSGEAVIEQQARQSVLSWLWNLLSDDTQSASLYRATRSWMALPLLSQQEVIAVLRVDHHEPAYFDAARQRLLHAVASQTALALRHAELLTRERETAVLAERNRIARDLHDAVSQTLFAATMIAGAMVRNAESGARADPAAAVAQAAAQAGAVERLNRAALAEMRLLMFELRPDALERTDLADLLTQAVDALASRGNTHVSTDLERGLVLDGTVRVALYRIAQEALSNIARHSQAATAQVTWQRQPDGSALLRIADDGLGFDPAGVEPGHFGVQNILERARSTGLAAAVDASPGAGTRWSIRVDAPNEAAAGVPAAGAPGQSAAVAPAPGLAADPASENIHFERYAAQPATAPTETRP